MELKKGENLIEHEAEIHSRPARTWFQTGKDKAKAEGLSISLVWLTGSELWSRIEQVSIRSWLQGLTERKGQGKQGDDGQGRV